MRSRKPWPSACTRSIAAARSSADADGAMIAVLALLDEPGRGVVGAGDHDARRPGRGRLDHDEPVALAARGEHHAERPCQSALDLLGLNAARHLEHLVEAVLRAEAQHLVALGPVAVDLASQLGDPLPRQRQRRDERRHALLRDVPPREHDDRLGRDRLARLERAGVLALEHRDVAVHRGLEQTPLVEAREAERALGHAQAQPLHGVARPGRRCRRGTRASSRGSRPRASRPRAGSAPAGAPRPRRAARSTGRKRCGPRRSAVRGAADATGRRSRTRAAGGCAACRFPCTAPSAAPL